MIEVIIHKNDVKGLQCVDNYILNRLRIEGIPITGFFTPFSGNARQGTLTKYSLTNELTKYVWSENESSTD